MFSIHFSTLDQSQLTSVLDPFAPSQRPIQSSTDRDWRLCQMKIKEIEGNSVEFTGILHLFKEEAGEQTVGLAAETIPPSVTEQPITPVRQQHNTLMILSIPDYSTPQDLLLLMGQHRNNILHIRIITDKIPKRYMMLCKFKTAADATSFYEEFNGRPFSSFEAEICHIVWIKGVVIEGPGDVFPGYIENDESKIPSPVELPTCPVCLDRMDSSVTGLLTSICHHTFHCHCIMKWGDTTCPVCRFNSSKPNDTTPCSLCPSTENLWICLICAHIGCGRYVHGHAREHYINSGHLYALELETQRVWDYKGDSYVHRLLQNTDGKLVHLPAPLIDTPAVSRIGLDTLAPNALVTRQDIQTAEKMEAVGDQVHELISSSLAQQRAYHEQALQKVELSSVERINHLEAIINSLQEENQRLWEERKELSDQLKEWRKKGEKSEMRLEKVVSRLSLSEKKVEEETLLNENLRRNQQLLEKDNQEKDALLKAQGLEIAELKEQVRDIMFFLETQQKIGVVDGIEGGSVVGVVSPQASPEKGKGKKKKK